MAKIVFIGAGSLGFTRGLVRDILTFPKLRDAELALVDTDPERLEFATRFVKRIVEFGRYPARVTADTDRRRLLEGADAVVVTILAGGTEVWSRDIEIPMEFGVNTNIGDTRGPSGIFRALRTIPVMLEICRDLERLCPGATMLNYTNPMAMLCRAMQRESRVRLTGLCHSVQGTAAMLARWIEAPFEEVSYTCAGINHLAWFTRYEWKGRDAYPLIREAVTTRPDIYNQEQVRNEMLLALDYYVTESSGHNSEYNWWFRKRPELIEKYCTHGTNWNPGVYAYILNNYRRREKTWKADVLGWLEKPEPIKLERGQEYAAYIINALVGGEPYEFNGNVPNRGLVDNLPDGACVEVPVRADHQGLTPRPVGKLPPQCAILTGLQAQVEELAVEGALTGNPHLVYQAVCHDPLTAAVLSLAEIRELVNRMLEFNRPYLPRFRAFTA
ncbi:MAG TPA: alpha-galactosidase [bacterium]|nr:alpha-galactosidase [bacterium]